MAGGAASLLPGGQPCCSVDGGARRLASTSGRGNAPAMRPPLGSSRRHSALAAAAKGRRRLVVGASAGGLHPSNRSFGQWAADNRAELRERLEAVGTVAGKSPVVRQLLAASAALRAALQPLVDVLAAVQAWWGNQYWNFIAFTEDETKRKWRWQRRTEAQQRFWIDAKAYVTGFVLTLAYQALVPPSVLFAVLIPMHLAWVLYDNMWVSPIALGILLMAPLKFVPWGAWTLV